MHKIEKNETPAAIRAASKFAPDVAVGPPNV
jgi:hypothetical protein